MNPSEDPNDRLLDSLLRESVRGGADLPLLEAIADRLDVSHPPAARKRPAFLPWLAAAACLSILGVVWSLWHQHQSGARGGTAPPAPVVDRHMPAPKAAPDNVPSSRRDSQGGIPTPAPVPAPRRDVAVAPKPIEEDRSTTPGEGGSQTLRDFVDGRSVAVAGEGMRVRGLCFPADPTLTEVFVHDPDAAEGTPGTRIDVKSHLAAVGQILSVKGDRVILSDHRERPKDEREAGNFGSVPIPRGATNGIFLLLPGSGEPAEPARRAVFLDVSPPVAPAGSAYVLNLSPAAIWLQLEKERHDFQPGEKKVIQVLPVGANGMTKMNAYAQQGSEWRRIASSMWPAPGPHRVLQVLWFNPASNMIEIRGFRDRVAPDELPGGGGGNGVALDRLVFLRDESTMWYVQFGLESGGKWAPRFVGLTPDKKKLQNRVSAVELLSPGDIFFKDGPMAGRFKFLGIKERDVKNAKTNLMQRVKIASYEDLAPLKAGMRYESQAGLPDAALALKAYYDRTAVLQFDNVEFRVAEHAKFTLPGDPAKTEYQLEDVSKDSVTVKGPTSVEGAWDFRSIPRQGLRIAR